MRACPFLLMRRWCTPLSPWQLTFTRKQLSVAQFISFLFVSIQPATSKNEFYTHRFTPPHRCVECVNQCCRAHQRCVNSLPCLMRRASLPAPFNKSSSFWWYQIDHRAPGYSRVFSTPSLCPFLKKQNKTAASSQNFGLWVFHFQWYNSCAVCWTCQFCVSCSLSMYTQENLLSSLFMKPLIPRPVASTHRDTFLILAGKNTNTKRMLNNAGAEATAKEAWKVSYWWPRS